MKIGCLPLAANLKYCDFEGKVSNLPPHATVDKFKFYHKFCRLN